jgi:hypothetical protein
VSASPFTIAVRLHDRFAEAREALAVLYPDAVERAAKVDPFREIMRDHMRLKSVGWIQAMIWALKVQQADLTIKGKEGVAALIYAAAEELMKEMLPDRRPYWWTIKDGRKISIRKMDDNHIRNCIAWFLGQPDTEKVVVVGDIDFEFIEFGKDGYTKREWIAAFRRELERRASKRSALPTRERTL